MESKFSKARSMDLSVDVSEQVMERIEAGGRLHRYPGMSRRLKAFWVGLAAVIIVALLIQPVDRGDLNSSRKPAPQQWLLSPLQGSGFSPYPSATLPPGILDYVQGGMKVDEKVL